MFCLCGLEEQIESHLQAPQPSILGMIPVTGQLGKLGNLKSVQTSLQKKISESPLKKLRLLGNLTKFQMRHKLIRLGRLPASLVADSLGCSKAFFCLQKTTRLSAISMEVPGSSGSSSKTSKTSTSTARSYISFF